MKYRNSNRFLEFNDFRHVIVRGFSISNAISTSHLLRCDASECSSHGKFGGKRGMLKRDKRIRICSSSHSSGIMDPCLVGSLGNLSAPENIACSVMHAGWYCNSRRRRRLLPAIAAVREVGADLGDDRVAIYSAVSATLRVPPA